MEKDESCEGVVIINISDGLLYKVSPNSGCQKIENKI